MAARIGGDEFVVVLDNLRRQDDAHGVAQRLLDLLKQPYGVGRHQLHCNVSMGIVLRAQAGADADSVLQDASIAMVEAKRCGGARYALFEPAMQTRAALRASTEAELRLALAEGQLFVVYQPVVGLTGAAGAHPTQAVAEPGNGQGVDRTVNSSAGVEALVRWRHPTRGLVPPLDFIGIAEDCGLIGPVGDFVLATACRQFVAWQTELGAGAPQALAVNLSRAQLGQPGLVESVRQILASTGMAATRLQLEVTESLAAQDETVQVRLHELKALGLTLALDDFGTGYSSLASLHLLPVDTVKIDRSFVSQVDTSHHHRVLIEATVRVANSLGMRTVAEGIETVAQADLVRELGCEKGQGYYYSKPLNAADVAPWLAARSAIT
jgi:predicted signal transduction protein with EAL and GGDEF domain